MSNPWSKGAPSSILAARNGGSAHGKGREEESPAGGGKMRYVAPPAQWKATAPPQSSQSPPEGKGKMKYVPPPTDAGVWNRPKVSAGGGPCQWEELAAKEEAQIKASEKKERSAATKNNSVGMSGNDKADMLATKMEFNLWTKADVAATASWARAEECRIPNKRVAKGGRLHKLMNIILNNCEFVNERLDKEKLYAKACRDPTLPSDLELKRRFIAPLAKRVLNKIEDEEAALSYKDDDPDSDDSEGMAM